MNQKTIVCALCKEMEISAQAGVHFFICPECYDSESFYYHFNIKTGKAHTTPKQNFGSDQRVISTAKK